MNTTRLASLFVIGAALSATGCKGKCNNPGPIDSCNAPEGGACYNIELVGTWSEDRQGLSLPPPAHFTTLYGAVHDSSYKIFGQGLIANEGLELLAEDGDIGVVQNDVSDQLDSGGASDQVCGGDQIDPTGSVTTSIMTDRGHTRLSMASMVAPSSDWFIGVDSLQLWDEVGQDWVDEMDVELFVYDAGTERDDVAFSLDNEPEDRNQPITVVHAQIFPGQAPAIARVRITRVR